METHSIDVDLMKYVDTDGFDGMSYEQLNNLFPNIPRGANEEAIQRLPTDTINNHGNDNDYKQKAKEEDGRINLRTSQPLNLSEYFNAFLSMFYGNTLNHSTLSTQLP